MNRQREVRLVKGKGVLLWYGKAFYTNSLLLDRRMLEGLGMDDQHIPRI